MYMWNLNLFKHVYWQYFYLNITIVIYSRNQFMFLFIPCFSFPNNRLNVLVNVEITLSLEKSFYFDASVCVTRTYRAPVRAPPSDMGVPSLFVRLCCSPTFTSECWSPRPRSAPALILYVHTMWYISDVIGVSGFKQCVRTCASKLQGPQSLLQEHKSNGLCVWVQDQSGFLTE